MATKTLGTILIIVVCILLFPVGIGILAAVFGIVFGLLGGFFGAVFGVIGGFLGAGFGVTSRILDGIFDWDLDLFDFNAFTVAALVILIILLAKRNQIRPRK